ncbi:MAG: LLM class flavin-dependent oxidoreductase [Chloroflexi bacterium]|nr:LLM class flavin-dependent oxidoreductase [Chloroflexota bacterium]MDA1147810.1 LLM class flavin-dependent oxidoreductase [Chloroflexota bacterium]
MRLGVLAGISSDWEADLEKVKIAEDLGYEFVGTGEAWGPSSIPWLTAIALNTSKVQIGTTILNVFSRTPAAIAQDFAVLDQLSNGRMVLGLGSSGQLVIEQFHGVPFKKPLRRLREYTEIFNSLIAGEKLNYAGEVFAMDRGFRLNYPSRRDHIPVWIAAITPKSIEQTGEIADGIYPIHWPKRLFADLRAQLAAAATAVGRGTAEMTIAPFTRVYVLDGTDDEAQWADAREPLHYYVNRMGVFYYQMLERNGFESEVAESREHWSAREAEASKAAISEAMVREIQVIGTIEEVREQLAERSALGADLQLIQMPHGSPAEAGRTLESYLRG